MRIAKRERALLTAGIVILLCMVIVVGTTLALFTDDKRVSNHLQAGDLSVTLKRTELVKRTLNDAGYLVTLDPDTTVLDFSDPSDKNVFGIEKDEKIVPGSRFVAKLQIENQSDVAFGYWIEVVCADKENGEALARQLRVTVSTDVDQSALVGDGLIVRGENGTCLGELAVGSSASFTVAVEFLDSFIAENGIESNDFAKLQNLSFDLVVHAVQSTTPPSASN